MSVRLPRQRRGRVRLVVGAATAAAVLVLTVTGVVGLPHPPESPTPVSTATSTASDPAGPMTREDEFARTVAEAIFGWDTTVDAGPAVVIERVLRFTDPARGDVPGLVAELRRQLPPEPIWEQLGNFRTRQHLRVHDVVVPAGGGTAGTTTLPADAIARSVTGTRVRDGVAFGDAVSSEHPVTVMIVFTCPPTGACVLLHVPPDDTPTP